MPLRREEGGTLRREGEVRGGEFGAAIEETTLTILPDLTAWWRPDKLLTDVALEITDWRNSGIGGTAWDTTQPTGTLRPDKVAALASMNNQPAVHHDAGDVLATATGTFWELADGEDMVAAVIFEIDAGTLFQLLLATTASIGSGGFGLEVRSASGCRSQVDDGPVGLVANSATAGLSMVATLALVYDASVSPTVDSLRSWTSGVGGTAVTGDQGAIVGVIPRNILLGAATLAGGQGLDGHIGEAFVMKGRLLTAAEDAAITNHWNSRYGQSFPGITQ